MDGIDKEQSNQSERSEGSATYSPGKATKKKKILSAIFNVAAGFGAAVVAKSVVTTFAAWACWPAIGTVLVSSLAVGVAVTVASHMINRKEAKKQGEAAPSFWSKTNGKRFMTSSLFSLVGGALFLNFDGVLEKCESLFSAVQADYTMPAMPTVEPEVLMPVEATLAPTVAIENISVDEMPVSTGFSCGSAAESFKEWVGGDIDDLSTAAQASFAGAENGRPQSVKDLGYFLFNGFGGVAENQELAVEMFKCAAADGNVQAQVDNAYSLFHGLGQVQNQQAALGAMQDIQGSLRAEWFVEQWSGTMGAPSVPDVQNVAQSIRVNPGLS